MQESAMTSMNVYIFSGKFKYIDDAYLYSQPQWEPEPDDSVTDHEYSEWEEKNPTHKLKDHIASYLDEDFIETVEVDYSYLASLNISDENISRIRCFAKSDNIFVLVYEQALGGFPLENEPRSNRVLTYCGVYSCTIKNTR